MTFYEYRDAIFASRELTANEKLTAIMIGSFFNYIKNEMCWPSNKTLSKATGLSISTIVRAKRVLAEKGYLQVWRRIDNSNLYRPLIPMGAPMLLENIAYNHVEQRVYAERPTNNEYNNEYNNEKNNEKNNNESSNEDSYTNSNTKEKPKEIITINESDQSSLADFKAQAATAASPWDGWR